MASSLAADKPSLAARPDLSPADQSDPFAASSSSSHHRFSHFDNQLFALSPGASPGQAKRALEAHLAETERRIQDASRLGTTLVQQRQDLADRLKDVEKQQSEGDITPELRQKLLEIEREYNEVGRETARAFLPKSRVSSSEMAGSPFGDSKRSLSPQKYESHGGTSPTKLSVPNRKQRNQAASRVHDIEFATEISTSLLGQVRNLQALLAEKEDTLKTVQLEKSRLEIEAEGFSQRLRSLDESENRYKDENWNLETQIHEFLAEKKDAQDREKKLSQHLNVLQAEKSSAQKELDEIKVIHAKLSEDHKAALKHHDIELGTVKRSMTTAENERGALQRKVDDLTGQNQELARAFAHSRGRLEDRDQQRGFSEEDFDTGADNATPEHSPPPSPVKGTPRHSMLESETLKSSLHHAHRMIQNLKGNIHREKTEKLELKRMLQDARDELEARRGEPGSEKAKRSRKVASREFKKPARPGQLGSARNSRNEIFVDDPNWEEDDGQQSPIRPAVIAARAAAGTTGASFVAPALFRSNTDASDAFETANEGTDTFETANERGTETEDFQTGQEDSGSDELTETEGGPLSAHHNRPSPPSLTSLHRNTSLRSTASGSGDEYSYEDAKTPTAQQPSRLRLRVSRGMNRRSRERAVSEEPQLQSSPASFANSSRNGTPQATGQSLFAELGDLSDEESWQGTPSRSRGTSRSATPTSRPATARNTPGRPLSPPPPVPKLPMVDSSMMTEPWEPVPSMPLTAIPVVGSGLAGAAAATEVAHVSAGKHSSTATMRDVSDAGSSTERAEMNDAQMSTDPEVKALMTDAHSSTDPETKALMSDAHSSTDPETKALMSDAHSSTDPETKALMSDAHSSTDPETKALMSDAHMSTDPEVKALMSDANTTTDLEVKKQVSDAASQWHEEQLNNQLSAGLLKVDSDERSRPISTSTYSDRSSQYDPTVMDEKLSRFPSPPSTRAHTPMASLANLEAMSTPLTISMIMSEEFEPSDPDPESPIDPSLKRASIQSPSNPVTMLAPLVFSSIQCVETEPVEPTPNEPRSPRRDAVIIPRDRSDSEEPVVVDRQEEPATPKNSTFLGSVFGWSKKAPSTPIIAEDDTRQPLDDSPMMQTPESQRPMQELSNNLQERAAKKPRVETMDESSQTALTATQIDEMLSSKRKSVIVAEDSQTLATSPRATHSPVIPVIVALNSRGSQESIGSVRRPRTKMADPDFAQDTLPVTIKRPGSAGSRTGSISSQHPPLPMDHRQVIAAAAQRTGSASGSMGPPSMPASAYKSANNPSFRPRTPSSQVPQSPISVRAGTTPRPMHSSGTAEIRSTSRAARSRASSISSFASEVDTRFNLKNGMPAGLASGTDPRMINAITQTMIGEYLWKYTRKAGRGAMSENRHRRYFWVHPYTRTLYWSDRDPSSAGRAELKAKSVPIEAVRVVTDDNVSPPGLHRKSLVIMTPGRSVKFTATTGQRHETWFNALSYLLLRTGDDALTDTDVVANGSITNEDIDEFNPGHGNAASARGPASISSYNSRTTHNESQDRSKSRISQQPQLTPSSRPSMGTFSRLSSYWKPSNKEAGSYSSRQSSHSVQANGGDGIYQASEVHDSAEDLREIIEKQDRESDRLENVRACCDGKHDVGHLHNSSTKSRHAHTVGQASGSKQSASQRARHDNSLRRTD